MRHRLARLARPLAAATLAAALVSAALAGGTGGTSPPQGQNATLLQGRPVAATAPVASQVLAWSGSAWVPAAGGGGASSLQAAYDGGRTIQTASAGTPVAITGAGSGSLGLDVSGGVAVAMNDVASASALSVSRNPAAPSAGAALSIYAGSNVTDQGLYVQHEGTGSALVANNFGGGNAIAATTTSATAIQVSTSGGTAIAATSTAALGSALVNLSYAASGAGAIGISCGMTRPAALDPNSAASSVTVGVEQHSGDGVGSSVVGYLASSPVRAVGSSSAVLGSLYLGDFSGGDGYDVHLMAVQDNGLRLGAINVLGGTYDFVRAVSPLLLSSSALIPNSVPFLQAESFSDASPVSSASTGALRYNGNTNQFEQSLNGGAWTAFGGGGASSLQGAYDGAGSGAGRTISVFSAGTPVAITGAGSGVALVVTAGVISSPGAHDYTERFGANSVVGAEQATALGNTANASAILSLAVGSFSTASATYATALGPSASASVIRSTVVGGSASTGGTGDTVVVGALAYASNGGVAIGARAGSAGTDGLAIGTDATTSATTWSIALGTGATTTSSGAIAVGNAAVASGNDAVAIGRSAATSASETVAVGHGATATNLSSTAVGDTASGSANYSAVFGANSVATGSYGTAVGMTANAITTWATAIGSFSSAGDNAVALGVGASATGLQSTAIGTGATASQVSATALGRGTNAVHTSSVAIGEGATTSAANECVFAHNLYLLCRAQIWQSGANTIATFDAQADSAVLGASGSSLGFFGATPVAKPTVTGSRGGNAALQSLLTAGANLGLWTDSTSP